MRCWKPRTSSKCWLSTFRRTFRRIYARFRGRKTDIKLAFGCGAPLFDAFRRVLRQITHISDSTHVKERVVSNLVSGIHCTQKNKIRDHKSMITDTTLWRYSLMTHGSTLCSWRDSKVELVGCKKSISIFHRFSVTEITTTRTCLQEPWKECFDASELVVIWLLDISIWFEVGHTEKHAATCVLAPTLRAMDTILNVL